MANYRAIASGNWSAGATWAGGAVPPNGAGHDVYSNNFTVTIDTNVNVALITNAAITASFVGGGTSAAVGGGFVAANGVTITSNIGHGSPAATLTVSGSNSASVVGNVAASSVTTGSNAAAISMNTSGSLTITGNVTGGGAGNGWGNHGVNAVSGTLNVIGNVNGPNGGNGSASPAYGIYSTTAPVINITGNVTGNSSNPSGSSGLENRAVFLSGAGVLSIVGNATSGSLTNTNAVFSSNANAQISITGDINALNGVNGVVAAGNANVVFSGSFISSVDGTQPVSCSRYRVTPSPLNARTRYASNGTGSYVDMFTSDNSTALNQAAPTDVRSGVAYGIGNSQTGRLTVPARGSVALNVNYGPSMPFVATRSGTTATATLIYSYPLVVGDTITVTSASNSEWNSTYTIASVVSGTSVTFTVPATHSASAGAGALMQTTGTAVLDPAAVASAVWGAATRTLTAGGGISASDVWDYATRSLTTSSGPTAVQIRQEMDSNSTKLANLDATVSSRLAPSGTLAVVTTLTNAPASVTPAQIRAEMDANSTKLANLDAAVSSRLATSGYTAPSAAPTAVSIRAEMDSNSTQLAAIKAKTDNLPASPAASGDIPSANITAIKAKTDLLNTDRLAQVSTVSTTGAQLAAALS